MFTPIGLDPSASAFKEIFTGDLVSDLVGEDDGVSKSFCS
jgi:hypothetical protein